MTAKIYNILRWDAVLFNESITQVPIIYIKPDDLFLEFAKANSYAVKATISGTNTIYDGKTIPGVVDSSANVPNCKPNFFKKHGWYTVALWANWYEYPHPKTLGSVTFSGLHELPEKYEVNPITETFVQQETSTKKKKKKDNKNKGFNITQILIISGIVILILIALIWFSKK